MSGNKKWYCPKCGHELNGKTHSRVMYLGLDYNSCNFSRKDKIILQSKPC